MAALAVGIRCAQAFGKGKGGLPMEGAVADVLRADCGRGSCDVRCARPLSIPHRHTFKDWTRLIWWTSTRDGVEKERHIDKP